MMLKLVPPPWPSAFAGARACPALVHTGGKYLCTDSICAPDIFRVPNRTGPSCWSPLVTHTLDSLLFPVLSFHCPSSLAPMQTTHTVPLSKSERTQPETEGLDECEGADPATLPLLCLCGLTGSLVQRGTHAARAAQVIGSLCLGPPVFQRREEKRRSVQHRAPHQAKREMEKGLQ